MYSTGTVATNYQLSSKYFLTPMPRKGVEQSNSVIAHCNGVVICVTCDVIRIGGSRMRSIKISSCQADHPLSAALIAHTVPFGSYGVTPLTPCKVARWDLWGLENRLSDSAASSGMTYTTRRFTNHQMAKCDIRVIASSMLTGLRNPASSLLTSDLTVFAMYSQMRLRLFEVWMLWCI